MARGYHIAQWSSGTLGTLTVCFGHPQDSTFTQRSYSLVQEYTSASLILLSECPPLSLHSWHRRIDSCCPQHCCVHGTEETECPPTRPHPSVGRETGRKLVGKVFRGVRLSPRRQHLSFSLWRSCFLFSRNCCFICLPGQKFQATMFLYSL